MLKGPASQLCKLILEDSPYIQKHSGTNFFPRSCHHYISQLSKKTCHELWQQTLVVCNHLLQLTTTCWTMSSCEAWAVANSNEQLWTTSGCEPRAVANHERLLIPTSGCLLQQAVANQLSRQRFLKVGICIDDETWEKEWHHWVSAYLLRQNLFSW